MAVAIVQNVQQDLTIKEERNRENGNPIGKNLTSIISQLFGKEKEGEIMELALMDGCVLSLSTDFDPFAGQSRS